MGLLAGLGACQGKRESTTTTTTKPPVTPTTHAPPPMTFGLCSEGLPTSGMWKCDPVLSDINGDNRLDLLAIPRLGKGPRVWLGQADGSWQESSSGLMPGMTSCGGGISAVDVNRDGHKDLAVADHCQGVFVYLGDGTGQWRMVSKALHPVASPAGMPEDYVGAEDLDTADVNGDGFIDIVTVAQDQGGLTVYYGDGTGTNWALQSETGLPNQGWGNRMKLHDVNQDGFVDLIASLGEGPRVWLGDGRGGWRASSTGLPVPMTQGLFSGIAVGDVNGDGRLDLAFANWIDGPEVFLQQADGSWADTPDAFPEMQGGAVGVALGDIDQDQKLDLLVSGRIDQTVGYVYGLFVLQGDGRGGWRYLRGTNLPETGLSTAWGVTLGDANGDGVLDLVYGTGGMVATDHKRAEPVLPVRLQVWCTQLSPSDRSVLAAARATQ
jgi:hypothetical protein